MPPTREEGDTTILSAFEEIIFIERRLILKEKVHTCRVHVAQRYQDTVAVRELTVEISRGEAASSAPGDDRPSIAAVASTIFREQK